jgi:hypothetical protein
MLANLALLALLTAPAHDVPRIGHALYRPRIELWTNHGDAVYTRGQNARVYFRVDRDAYVTILRVDTDGRVRVLFPRDPRDDNFARGGRDYEIEGYGRRDAFHVDDYPGVGYVFAVAAADPFVYDALVTANHWDYRAIADGHVRGDPYIALTELANRMVPAEYADWDYDLVPYYVERHYDYPRFLCYDCHSYASWAYWNPYHYSCAQFRIVIYDSPWYYPYRYYRGTRVVFVRPFRPEPRFIFKDRSPSDVFVTRERQRPANDRGVRGRDLGAIIPAPRDRVRPDRADVGHDGRERPDRQERPGQLARPVRPDQRQIDRPQIEQPQVERPRVERPQVERPQVERPQVERPQVERPRAEQPQARQPIREARPERHEPRATPERSRPAEPRAAPRSEPKGDAPKSTPQRREPELKRRKS